MDLTYEILTDREQYPDDQEITLSNGKKVTVKQFRDTLIPKSDMTKLSDGWKKKEQQLVDATSGLNEQVQTLSHQLEEALRARAAGPARPEPTDTGVITEEQLLADPVLGLLARNLKATTEALAKANQRLETHERTLGEYRNAWIQGGFMTQLERLKANPDNKDTDWNDFLDFTKRKPVIDAQTGLADLEATHTNYAHKRLVEAARKAGETAGYEKGKEAAKVPRIPGGRRAAPPRPAGLPEDLQHVTDEMLAADPDMAAALEAGAE